MIRKRLAVAARRSNPKTDTSSEPRLPVAGYEFRDIGVASFLCRAPYSSSYCKDVSINTFVGSNLRLSSICRLGGCAFRYFSQFSGLKRKTCSSSIARLILSQRSFSLNSRICSSHDKSPREAFCSIGVAGRNGIREMSGSGSIGRSATGSSNASTCCCKARKIPTAVVISTP